MTVIDQVLENLSWISVNSRNPFTRHPAHNGPLVYSAFDRVTIMGTVRVKPAGA